MSTYLLRRLLGLTVVRAITGFLLWTAWVGTVAGAEVDSDARPIRLLVLNSGRVLNGDITPGAGGYLVQKPHGRMFVPNAQVRLEAKSLDDAYRKLRRSLPELTANSHIALARWCLTNQRYASAKRELRDALEMEPDRTEARQLLARIQDLQHGVSTVPKSSVRPERESAGNPDARSLAGLRRQTAREFVTQVQPILLSSCSRSSCHSPRDQRVFVIERLRNGGRRAATERNLASVFRQLDFVEPSRSPLLETLRTAHGPQGRTVLTGSGAARQLQAIERWVAGVSREFSESHGTRDHVQLAGAETVSSDVETRSARPDAHVDPPAGSGVPPAAVQTGPISTVRKSDPDPFSPEAFNRLIVPRALPGSTGATRQGTREK